jgi:hypothetical protein
MKRPARVPLQLPESLHKCLNAYALAATATGVGALAFAQPAEAKIVYTHAHRLINVGQVAKLDLNHDGIADFRISISYAAQGGELVDLGVVNVNRSNRIWGYKQVNQNGYASALSAGARIGSNQQRFDKKHYGMAAITSGGDSWGPWHGAQNRFLGLKFLIKGQVHYGWARLSVTKVFPFSATLTGYAYETIPNKPIIAGKTHGGDEATLGQLATGASAIPAWRMKPTAATTH